MEKLLEAQAANERELRRVQAELKIADARGGRAAGAGRYFNDELIDENFLLSVVPNELTAVMIASAIPAAINAYSIEVAPD